MNKVSTRLYEEHERRLQKRMILQMLKEEQENIQVENQK